MTIVPGAPRARAIYDACMRLGSGLALALVIGCGSSHNNSVAADAPTDGPPILAHTHTLFLDFDGVTLGSGSDDATMNTSALVTGPTTLPSYLGSDGSADRGSAIAAIAAEVEDILEPYQVTVVTARPASGTYMMVVTTDAPSSKLQCTDCPGDAPADCGAVDSPIAFNFGGGSALPLHGVTADTVAELGLTVLGIPTSAVPNDCMCFSDANCTFPPSMECTIGGAGTAISQTKPGCPATGTVMDENGLFLDGFGPS